MENWPNPNILCIALRIMLGIALDLFRVDSLAKNEAKTHSRKLSGLFEKLKIEKANPREIRAVTHAHPLAVLLLECLLDIHSASAEIVRSLADSSSQMLHFRFT